MTSTRLIAESSDGILESVKQTYGGVDKNVTPYSRFEFANDVVSTENKSTKYDAKNGKYVIGVTLSSGVKKTVTYYIDTKSPAVSIKNGVLKCKDNKKDGYASGIKSMTVNGKSAKNGCKVKKGDKIVVKDKAGNVTKKTVK